MKAWVAVTDLKEINFWQPGGTRLFRTLEMGHPFLFKLHAPENFIVGVCCSSAIAWGLI